MNDNLTESLEQSAQLTDILLVLEKDKMRIQAVKNLNEKGEMETVDPTKKNENQFLRIDKHGNFLSNFFSNFYSQLKNPTNFIFFKVPDSLVVDKANKIQNHYKTPQPENEKSIEQYKINPETYQQNNSKHEDKMETEKTEYRFDPAQIDWKTMKNLGLSQERLENLEQLDHLLKGYKTNKLVPISINFGSTILRTDVRLSLQQVDDKVVPALHGIRKEPNLNYEFFGHTFTDEDKKNLLSNGNMGRVVD